MHDILRDRLIRKIESLPEAQVYQILDYIEFLESKHAADAAEETSGLKRFAEAMEDKMRKRAMSPATLREAFQLISAADRVLANVSSAGKKLMEELMPGAEDVRQGGEQDGVSAEAGRTAPAAGNGESQEAEGVRPSEGEGVAKPPAGDDDAEDASKN